MKKNFVIKWSKLENQLKQAGIELKDYTVPLKQSGVYMQRQIAINFNSEGQGTWKKLTVATLEARWHGGDKPLQDTGALKVSATTRPDIKVLSPKKFQMGSSKVYAGVHQFGYKHIPARPYMYFTDQSEKTIEQIFLKYARGLLNG